MGSTTQGIRTVLHPVSDLEKAKPVYAALLGVEPSSDAPYYVGFEAEGQQIGLVPADGPQAMASPVAYWHVADIGAGWARGRRRRRRPRSRRLHATWVGVAWWPPSPTRMAMFSG